MKKILVILCCVMMCTMPAMADRTNSTGQIYEDIPSNTDLCTQWPEKCLEYSTTKRHAKKKSDTGKIVIISVAAGAVFAGAMYYIFKKMPSENNPGQVKLAEF